MRRLLHTFLNFLFFTVLALFTTTQKVDAVDEMFKVQLSGTEFCGDFLKGPVVYEPLIVHNATELSTDVYDQFGNHLFTLWGDGFATKQVRKDNRLVGYKATYYRIVFGTEWNFFQVQGTATTNLTGETLAIAGTFLHATGDLDGCFTQGTFKSVQKLQ
jgi:hypothetical protein